MCSIVSNIFQVYSPKSFPGMSESTFLTRSFSDQGVRIRIRKEPRSSSSNLRKIYDNDTDDDDSLQDHYMELSPLPRNQFGGRSPSPLPETLLVRPTLPSPQEIFRSSPMSMQNILSNENSPPLFPPTTPADDDLNNRLFSTRKLPLPLPSPAHHHQQQNIQQQQQQQQLQQQNIQQQHNLHDHTITQPWIKKQQQQSHQPCLLRGQPSDPSSRLKKH
ncbi:hypothetical protein MFLAVUS_005792 [Mucor flavus]|uniref:Velvet domain-containing protein n=1 Tax=Mucor flavus TaxID=439312 RepID=A0ABP9YZQ2_9FUNG